MADLYLEDLEPGKRWTGGRFVMTSEEALDFAARYDPQPMHLDAEAASAGRFGALIASGWNTAALAMREIARARLFGDIPVLGLGVDRLMWPKPVFHGDIMDVEWEVVDVVPSKSKPDFGVVKVQTTARNQRGEVVLVMTSNVWVPRRPVR
jgi:acyl dehydratase